jgi:galactokinase
MNDSRLELFSRLFHQRPQIFASAPGRINIIGEHTDYNNGYVLPAAIHLRTCFLGALRRDTRVQIWADDFQQKDTFDLDAISPSEEYRWANYIKGIFWVLKQDGHRLGGVDAMVWGEVPLESGLSSSAALEVSVIKGLSSLFGIDLAGLAMAKLAQKAENDFVGVQCGLMDQFIAVFGKKDTAVFLDCETMDFALLPPAWKRPASKFWFTTPRSAASWPHRNTTGGARRPAGPWRSSGRMVCFPIRRRPYNSLKRPVLQWAIRPSKEPDTSLPRTGAFARP